MNEKAKLVEELRALGERTENHEIEAYDAAVKACELILDYIGIFSEGAPRWIMVPYVATLKKAVAWSEQALDKEDREMLGILEKTTGVLAVTTETGGLNED